MRTRTKSSYPATPKPFTGFGMSPDYYRKISGAQFTHEWVLIQAFRFLLEREPNTSILKEFDLSIINRYFPEFEEEMAARLGR